VLPASPAGHAGIAATVPVAIVTKGWDVGITWFGDEEGALGKPSRRCIAQAGGPSTTRWT
jgi:hypothetical protein